MTRRGLLAISFTLAGASWISLVQGRSIQGWYLLLTSMLLLLLAGFLPGLVYARRPFIGHICMAGLPSAHASHLGRDSRASFDCLSFELEILRLVNELRTGYGSEEVSLNGALLGEARQNCSRASQTWRFLPDCLRRRMVQRGNFSAGLELGSVLTLESPGAVVSRWMRRKRTRTALLGRGFDVGAVGVAYEGATGRGCVTLLMAKIKMSPGTP